MQHGFVNKNFPPLSFDFILVMELFLPLNITLIIDLRIAKYLIVEKLLNLKLKSK